MKNLIQVELNRLYKPVVITAYGKFMF